MLVVCAGGCYLGGRGVVGGVLADGEVGSGWLGLRFIQVRTAAVARLSRKTRKITLCPRPHGTCLSGGEDSRHALGEVASHFACICDGFCGPRAASVVPARDVMGITLAAR